jgi:hypothetical protein
MEHLCACSHGPSQDHTETIDTSSKKPIKYDIERETPNLPIIDDSATLPDLLAALFTLFEARIYHF